MMVSMELPVATRAFFFGMRRVRRRYRAPRNDWVLPALIPASPRAAPREGLPRPVELLPLRFPADGFTWGDHFAQAPARPAGGSTVTSPPVLGTAPWVRTAPRP